MATISEVFQSILSDEALKAEFAQIADEAGLAAFLQARGCEATVEEARAFIAEKASVPRELSVDDLDAAAGGFGDEDVVLVSFCITCVPSDVISTLDGEPDPDILCEMVVVP